MELTPSEIQEIITEYRLDDGDDFFYDQKSEDPMDLWHSENDLKSDIQLQYERDMRSFNYRFNKFLKDKQWNK